MRHLKMIAVAAIAVGAIMGAAGASSAFAATSTALCKVNTNPCPAASIVKATEAIEATSTNAELTSSIVNVICEDSKVALTVSGMTAAPETGSVNSLGFSKCKTTGGVSCEVTTQGFPATATLETTTAPNGKLTVTPGTAGDPGAKVVCGALINCTFTTKDAVLSVIGSHGSPTVLPLEAVASGVVLTSTGGICPKTASWDATYIASAPNGGILYVEE